MAVPILQPQKIRTNNRQAKRLPATESTEWAGIWSLSLGLAAVAIASVVYFARRDGVGASFIFLGTAAIIALLMRATAQTQN